MIGLAVRIDRLERCLDYELRQPPVQATGIVRLRHQLHIDRLTVAIVRLRGLAEDAQERDELRDRPKVRRGKARPPVSETPVVAPPSVTPVAISPIGLFTLSAVLPRGRALRDDELAFDTVWTPHRDAASLIGNYERRTMR